MTISIKTARVDQLTAMADLHMSAFPNFFLTSLGPRFLRTLYLAIERDPTGLVLTASDPQGRLVGFAAGVGESQSCFMRLIRSQFLRFAIAALPSLIRRPQILPRVLHSLRRSESSGQGENRQGAALLMSIAVDPRCAGQGIGGRLIESFLDRMALFGVQAVCLTTDRDANDAVNAFYLHHGFRLKQQFVTSEGRQMNEYVIELGSRGRRDAA
ncbi:GNAT family N-acetyltransferase [Candidatus Laterigemmans baculatus]|uniref:GNAT family N-acetyltransferase n=1 Tax=Candidatus Laterigemmans baculatus TaxID=2770505 RepID=UPI0013DB9992|nr:GNAT family N-acetyltransferase [Candidatus Laterigemmans baculatus]